MPLALLSLIWTSVVIFIVAIACGLRLWGAASFMQNHIASALTATIVALFAHTMTMFYFIGTGKKIKEFASSWDRSIQQDIRGKIVAMKRKIFPHMTLICLVLVTAFILGGAHSVRLITKGIHSFFAYGALVYHVHVAVLETIFIFRNLSLIQEVNNLHQQTGVKSVGH